MHPLMHYTNNGWIQLIPNEKSDLIVLIKTLCEETFLTNPTNSSPGKLPDRAKAIK